MTFLISCANVYRSHCFENLDILIKDGIVADISPRIVPESGIAVYNFKGYNIFPGFVDVHVHLREPGFSYKEDINTGTLAAAHGGVTHLCAMPNLNPVPDSREHLDAELDIIKEKANVEVKPYGAVTVGENGTELSDITGMKDDVCAFSDDGKGIQSDELMKTAMEKIRDTDKIFAAHCEVNSLLRGGYIHYGIYAKTHGHRGICSESEYKMIARDIELAKKTGVKYHVCHISAKESVELIRKAKSDGLDITCETAPHYLILDENDLCENARFKMNPPLRSKEDRLSLIEGIKDGTIDMIATDHAPHSAEEKSRGLEKSLMGVVGLETSFAAMYTHMVKTGIITLEKLISLMHDNPMKRFGLGTNIVVGQKADFCVFNLEKSFKVNPDVFFSKGRTTPFDGKVLFGENVLTIYSGKAVYNGTEFKI